jgi:hypothetical protein
MANVTAGFNRRVDVGPFALFLMTLQALGGLGVFFQRHRMLAGGEPHREYRNQEK